jgi:hypothetical protein
VFVRKLSTLKTDRLQMRDEYHVVHSIKRSVTSRLECGGAAAALG